MEESALSIFRKLPETKKEVSSYKNLIRESVENRDVEPLLFLKQVTALEQLVKSLKQDDLIKDVILEEAEKYSAKTFEYIGAKFQIKEVGTRWDFSGCDDTEWEKLDTTIKDLTQKKKERESFLKTLNSSAEIYDEGGVQIKPPSKSSSTQVVITLSE
jgi:hypothetical protein